MPRKSLAAKKEKAAQILDTLYALYPESDCTLSFDGDPFRLLVMARLSAQCTDARVNLVCEELFRKFPDVYAFAAAPYEAIEELVRPCGLYRMKAKNIKDASVMLIDRFDGKVPSDMDALLSLPGVGRKIANLLRGDCFGLGGIVADTHCIRLAGRMGLTESKDPAVVERDLEPLIPKDRQSGFCHRMVDFGRDRCKAQNPHCDGCPVACGFSNAERVKTKKQQGK